LVGFRVKLDGDDAFIAVHGGAQSMAAEGLVRRGQSDFTSGRGCSEADQDPVRYTGRNGHPQIRNRPSGGWNL
jgi:hypothetical protein